MKRTQKSEEMECGQDSNGGGEEAWAAVKKACVAAQTKVSTETTAARRDFDRGAITDEQRKDRCKIAWDLYEQEARAAFKGVIPTPDTDGRQERQEMDLAFENVEKAKARAKEAEMKRRLTWAELRDAGEAGHDLAKEFDDEAGKQESAANAALAEADAELTKAMDAFFAYHQWRFLINKI